jgi:hypothetical protein
LKRRPSTIMQPPPIPRHRKNNSMTISNFKTEPDDHNNYKSKKNFRSAYRSNVMSPASNLSRRSYIPIEQLEEKAEIMSMAKGVSAKKKKVTIICKRKNSRNGQTLAVEKR